MTPYNETAIRLLKGARRAIECRADRFVCCALFTGRWNTHYYGPEEELELDRVVHRLRGMIQRALGRTGSSVRLWLEAQLPGNVVVSDDELYEYRLAWIDEMIAQIKCGAINIDNEEEEGA